MFAEQRLEFLSFRVCFVGGGRAKKGRNYLRIAEEGNFYLRPLIVV